MFRFHNASHNKYLDLRSLHECIKVKSELLCYGLVAEENEMLRALNPHFLEPGFVHGSQVVLNDATIVNVPVNEAFVHRYSEYTLIFTDGSFRLRHDSGWQCRCVPLTTPRFFQDRVDGNTTISDIMRPHSNNVIFVVPVRRCAFFDVNLGCKFCTFNEQGVRPYAVQTVARAFEMVCKHNGDWEVAIGGATPDLRDFGTEYYSRIVRCFKEISKVPVSLEIVPPKKKEDIGRLLDAGVDALIMNLEIFTQNIRNFMCPGKSRISLQKYVASWEYAVDFLGEGNVSSALIAGLEPLEKTIEAAEKMISIGVIPTIIPFRPHDSCELNYRPPCKPHDLVYVFNRISGMLNQRGLNPYKQRGCTRCGGCSLEVDAFNEYICN